MIDLVLPFRRLDLSQVAVGGGKNANLGELIAHLQPLGVRVPDGFALVPRSIPIERRLGTS